MIYSMHAKDNIKFDRIENCLYNYDTNLRTKSLFSEVFFYPCIGNTYIIRDRIGCLFINV